MLFAHGEAAVFGILFTIVGAMAGLTVPSLLFGIFGRRPSDWWLVLSVFTVIFGGAFFIGAMCLVGRDVAWWAYLLCALPFVSGLFSVLRWRQKRL